MPETVSGTDREKIPDRGESVSPAGPEAKLQVDADVAEAAGSGTARDGASAVDSEHADRSVRAVREEGILMGSVSPEELFESLESLGFEIKQASDLAKNGVPGKDHQ